MFEGSMTKPTSTATDLVALNADVVGYSALMADDFDMTAAAMGDIRKIVEADVTGSGGTLVNFVGDNFMAVFSDSKDAMQSAIAITRAVEAYNDKTPKAPARGQYCIVLAVAIGPLPAEGDSTHRRSSNDIHDPGGAILLRRKSTATMRWAKGLRAPRHALAAL